MERPALFFATRRSYSASAVLVFPVPGLSLREPFERRGEAFLPRLVPFRLRDPIDVFLPIAGAELLERGRGRLVLLQAGREVLRHGERRRGPLCRPRPRGCVGLV